MQGQKIYYAPQEMSPRYGSNKNTMGLFRQIVMTSYRTITETTNGLETT